MTGSNEPTPEETVRLRATPPSVARLSRPVIITLMGGALVAIGAVLAFALHTRAPKTVEPKADDSENRPPLTAVADAPKTYGDVPKLGPPLPGDLGRPIVSAQARGVAVPAPGMATQPAPRSDPALEARQRAREAARASALFSTSARSPVGAPEPLLRTGEDIPLQVAPSAVPSSGQAAKTAFVEKVDAKPTVSGFRPVAPAGRLVLLAQTVIPAALISAVNSDLPGPVFAQVTRNVYDSLTGRTVLIPQGSKLIGAYDAQVAFGQKRVLLVWERVIFPDGRSLQLDRLVGADGAGRSGLNDTVDAHWGAMAKAALLSSVLGLGAELGSDDDGDLARALRQGVQDTANQTGQQVVRRQLDVQPTLTLRAGLPLTILVTRDMIFDADAAASPPAKAP
jgi:type IV secretory pathway VirB10-like protein